MHRPVLKGLFRVERRMKIGGAALGDGVFLGCSVWSPIKPVFASMSEAREMIAELEQKCQLWEYRIPHIHCRNIWPSSHAIDRFRERFLELSTSDISDRLRSCVERSLPSCVWEHGWYKYTENGMTLVIDFDGDRAVIITVMRSDQEEDE